MKNRTTDELLITTGLLRRKVLVPSIFWVVCASSLNLLWLDDLTIRKAQIYSGLVFYLFLLGLLSSGVNKIVNPDYSYKLTPLFFAGIFGVWLSLDSLMNSFNSLQGLFILFCSFNSLLFVGNIRVAKSGGYLLANINLTNVVLGINSIAMATTILLGLANLIFDNS